MKRKATTLAALLLAASACRADNPIIQTNYTADPAVLVAGDTVYLYTGHDEDRSRGFVMKEWRCYSSRDMVNWTDHGSPLSLATFSWAQSDAWAGQCIERDGKYFWYVPINQKSGGMAIGVAVGDSPLGPFKDALGHPLVSDHFGDIDPTVFIDDDGQAYLPWGNPVLKYIKLNKDMISYDKTVGENGIVRSKMTPEEFGKRRTPDRSSAYEEAPWLYKRAGRYYMVYAGGPVPEHLAYATGPTAVGPWSYAGVIMPTQGAAFTNHPAVIDFKGHSYLFYHNGALPGGGGFTRSVCVDEFKYGADGSIPQFDMTTKGPAAIANVDPYQRTEAETMAWSSGIRTEPSTQGGMAVCQIDDGDFTEVKNVDFGLQGAAVFIASIAFGTHAKAVAAGSIELHLDHVDGPLIATLPVSYTAGQWRSFSTGVSGATGVHDLFFVFKGETASDLLFSDGKSRHGDGGPSIDQPTRDAFKFDYWQFSQKSAERKVAALSATVDRYKLEPSSADAIANLKVMALYSDGTSNDVTSVATLQVDKPSIVRIAGGSVTALAVGSAEVTASFGGNTVATNLLVKDLKAERTVDKLTADVNRVDLINGSTRPVTLIAIYADGHSQDVSRTAIATANPAGVAQLAGESIRAIGEGTTTLKASFKGELGEAASTDIAVRVKNRDPFVQNEAEECNEQNGLIVEDSTEAGKNLCDANNGEWFRFNSLDFGSGAKGFNIRAASATEGGMLELHLDSLEGPLIGTVKVDHTGGWQNWVTSTCILHGATGMHDVYFKFVGGRGVLFNVNWWKFDK